jgi:hypothetical protein
VKAVPRDRHAVLSERVIHGDLSGDAKVTM